jgi:hypothetical protein
MPGLRRQAATSYHVAQGFPVRLAMRSALVIDTTNEGSGRHLPGARPNPLRIRDAILRCARGAGTASGRPRGPRASGHEKFQVGGHQRAAHGPHPPPGQEDILQLPTAAHGGSPEYGPRSLARAPEAARQQERYGGQRDTARAGSAALDLYTPDRLLRALEGLSPAMVTMHASLSASLE